MEGFESKKRRCSRHQKLNFCIVRGKREGALKESK